MRSSIGEAPGAGSRAHQKTWEVIGSSFELIGPVHSLIQYGCRSRRLHGSAKWRRRLPDGRAAQPGTQPGPAPTLENTTARCNVQDPQPPTVFTSARLTRQGHQQAFICERLACGSAARYPWIELCVTLQCFRRPDPRTAELAHRNPHHRALRGNLAVQHGRGAMKRAWPLHAGAALLLLLLAAAVPCVTAAVNTTTVTVDECIEDWDAAMEAGNCSATECSTNCISSLGTVRCLGAGQARGWDHQRRRPHRLNPNATHHPVSVAGTYCVHLTADHLQHLGAVDANHAVSCCGAAQRSAGWGAWGGSIAALLSSASVSTGIVLCAPLRPLQEGERGGVRLPIVHRQRHRVS